MIESFIIPYPTTAQGKSTWNREYGLNAYYSGKHYKKRIADAEFWHGMVALELMRQRVRRVPFEKPVKLTFYWNDALDISNHAVMAKMIEDALIGRVIKNDSRKWVKRHEHCFHDKPYIGIVIEEII